MRCSPERGKGKGTYLVFGELVLSSVDEEEASLAGYEVVYTTSEPGRLEEGEGPDVVARVGEEDDARVPSFWRGEG